MSSRRESPTRKVTSRAVDLRYIVQPLAHFLDIKNSQNIADCGLSVSYEGFTSDSHSFPKQRPTLPLRCFFPCFWQSQTYRNWTSFIRLPNFFGITLNSTKTCYSQPNKSNEETVQKGLKILEVFLVILEKK